MPAVTPSCRPGINAAEFWIVGRERLAVMSAEAPADVRHALKPANLFVAGAAYTPSPVGQSVADFRSYAALTTAIRAHRIPRGVHWLMYDNEQWRATPVNEQRSPGRYESLFASLAHRHGYRVILAPAQDLALGSGRSRLPRGTPAWRRYLAMHLPAESARAGDIYEIQAQAYELPQFRRHGLYRRLLRDAVQQARAANPGITLFAGLSTNRVPTVSDLFRDYLAARGLVAGFWLNIDDKQQRQRQMAEQFLGMLPPGAAAAGRTCTRTTRDRTPPPAVLGSATR